MVIAKQTKMARSAPADLGGGPAEAIGLPYRGSLPVPEVLRMLGAIPR